MPQASPSDMATRSLPPYFAHIVKVKFTHPHLLLILTKYACHHYSFWGSRCDSNHAPTISLKLAHFQSDFGISFWSMTQVLSRHTSSPPTSPPPSGTPPGNFFEVVKSPAPGQNFCAKARPRGKKAPSPGEYLVSLSC